MAGELTKIILYAFLSIAGAFCFFYFAKKAFDSFETREDTHGKLVEEIMNIWGVYIWAGLLGLVFGNPIVGGITDDLPSIAGIVATILAVVGLIRLLTITHKESIGENITFWVPSGVGVFLFVIFYLPGFVQGVVKSLIGNSPKELQLISFVIVLVSGAIVAYVEFLGRITNSNSRDKEKSH